MVFTCQLRAPAQVRPSCRGGRLAGRGARRASQLLGVACGLPKHAAAQGPRALVARGQVPVRVPVRVRVGRGPVRRAPRVRVRGRPGALAAREVHGRRVERGDERGAERAGGVDLARRGALVEGHGEAVAEAVGRRVEGREGRGRAVVGSPRDRAALLEDERRVRYEVPGLGPGQDKGETFPTL